MTPPHGAHLSRTLGTGLTVFLLTLAACGGSPAGNRKTDGGKNDAADGSAAAGGSSTTGSAGAGGSATAGNGAAGSTAGAGGTSPDGGAGVGLDGGAGVGLDGGAGVGLDGGTCPTSPDGGTPPSGADSVTFLANVTVSTIAGSGVSGNMNGTAAQSLFSNPVSVIIEPAGSLLACDFQNNSIRRIANPDATVAVSTLTAQAGFQTPYGMTYGTDGTLYVDTDYNPSGVKNMTSGTIWKIDTTTGVATAFAVGVGRPRGLATLSDGRLVLGDYQNQRLLLLDTTTGTATTLAGHAGCPGFFNAKGDAALFDVPYGIVVLPSGTIVVADEGNRVLRAVTLAGDVTTYAGDGGNGTVDGPRLQARFSQPSALAVDAAGDVFVTDVGAHRIRRVAADGTVTTVAGDGTAGFMDGTGAASQLFGIEGIASTSDGKTLYVTDGSQGVVTDPYNRVRRIVIGP
jgi:sugar lactone lactonase YvrE